MLRTNTSLLVFTEKLHAAKTYGDALFLKQFSSHQFLLKQDALPAHVLIVREGVVKCFIAEENGKDFIVEFLGRGEIAGEVEALRSSRCICNIEALTPVEVFVLALPLFNKLLQDDAAFSRLLLAALADRIANTSRRAAFQQLHTLEHGLEKLLDWQRRQNITLTKEDMAAYLGVSVRSLNRALKEKISNGQ